MLNDCHAEVLVRRALLCMLLRQSISLKQDDYPSLCLIEPDGLKNKLKMGVKLHLYISTTPCGDASMIKVNGQVYWTGAKALIGDD